MHQHQHQHLHQHQAPAEEDEWGYEDEEGNWVSFNDNNNEEVEFLRAQLPSEDEFLDGLGVDTAPAGDEWGYHDDKGAC
jgi:E3 ubiquitin-protein ligase makorin